MEILKVENLSFSYPKSERKALDGMNLTVNKGDFVLVCGESGCGKTTLLRLLKNEISPFGEMSGKILYAGRSFDEISENVSASEIGFVGQNPDEQIVTDKVWHELAFGLENLGLEQSVIRRRVGEMASFFGIHGWYHRKTNELSGGQKQLLNLASVMAMQPKILLLDEPTSQLDPIASSDFIATLRKINTELGLTIIMVEHRLEEVFSVVDKVVVMENAGVLFEGSPREVSDKMKGHPMQSGLPSAVRIFGGLDGTGNSPLTVREGREFLEKNYSHRSGGHIEEKPFEKTEAVLEAKDIWFRYEKNQPDVISGLNIKIGRGEIYSVLGGNGSGKTTMLNVLAGLDKPYKGKIRIDGKKIGDYKNSALYGKKLSVLPQNPKAVFLKETVKDDLAEMLNAMNIPKSEHEERILTAASRFGITKLLNKHPYDLSGGEMQRCALCKLMLAEPQILLLDEPTKGFDAYSKIGLSKLLKELKAEGKTVVIVTHDIEFAAEFSTRCALFFDGKIISEGTPKNFFSENNFYTTAANRISRELFTGGVLCEDVIAYCKGSDGK